MPKYIKGLNKDTGHVDQTEGTYRYAKNALLNDRAGSIQNEHGTSPHVSLLTITTDSNAPTIIGSIETTDDRIVLFGVTSVASYIYLVQGGTAEILLYTLTGSEQEGSDVDLKFSENFPIEGTYKIGATGSLIIYWTDNHVPPRALNVTRQQDSVAHFIYGIDPVTSPNTTYIDRLNLFPHAGPVPRIEFKEVKNGGALKTGIYYLFLAYVDIDGTQTNYITSSLPVPIVEDIESVLPLERYDGAPADSQTGKVITWTITNINTDYKYLRPVVVSRINNVEQAYVLNDVQTLVGESSTTISFSMLEGYASGAVEDVVIDAVAYDTAKTLTQLDSVLYTGNLSGSKDIGYQKYANFIKLHSTIKKWDFFDPFSLSNDNLNYGFYDQDPSDILGAYTSKEFGYRDTRNMIENRGYMRDEVYAFYIAFVLKDGSMSYAYHIPGRTHFSAAKKDNLLNIGTVIANNIPDGGEVSERWGVGGYDNRLSDMASGAGKLFHFYDFSNQPNTVDTRATKMNFWENLNEFYPNTSDYEYWDAEADIENNTDSGNNAYNLKKDHVRHHHFPSNNNVDRSMIDHSAANPSVISEDDTTETTYHYFTFDDATDGAGWWNGARVLHNVNVNHTGEFVGEFLSLAGKLTEMIGPGGDFEGATWTAPTDAILDAIAITDQPGSSENSIPGWHKDGNDPWPLDVSMTDQNEMGPDGITTLLGTFYEAGGLEAGTDKGFFCFALETEILSSESIIIQNVRPLGFKLSDLKIPAEIASKVQGFRIYYASRDHNNRRILGQDHIKKASSVSDKDISACSVDSGVGSKEDFLMPWGHLRDGSVKFGTFHDFYMLNGGYGGESGVSKGISTATHVNRLHKFSYFCFKGPGHNYEDVDPLTDSCLSNVSATSFHICHNSNVVPSNFNHHPLREKCRTYVNGDSIYDGRALGFGKRINNMGGERHIMLGVLKTRPISQPEWIGPDASSAPWAEINEANVSTSYSNPRSYKVKLDMFNLCAFKTDMYSSIDTQKLVWTGYEVLGDELDNFIVQESRQSDDDKQFITDDIYGGDTFICRHGYRISHRPEWTGTTANDHKTVIATICESSDNINLRHEESNSSACFPGAPLKRVLDLQANINLTDVVNMKYNTDYSLGKRDVKFPPALPLRDLSPDIYPNRVQRSAKADNMSVIDNYRVFLAAEIKDLPRNRGSLWNLVSFNNLLYMHMQDSLFRTKGKQTMQMADGSEAFLGSGNIFEQDADEMVQTESGYGGTQSQWAAIVTSQGYFCLDYRNRKVYLVTDKMTDIGRAGMAKWFIDNIPFGLEEYGIGDYDNPITGVGFHATWDEKYNRILLTKRDIIPTEAFKDAYRNAVITFDKGKKIYLIYRTPNGAGAPISWDDSTYFKHTGWTISYSPNTTSWVSFHDYVPYLYSYDKQHMLSMQDGGNINEQRILYEHSDKVNVGNFYGTLYNFEFEFIYTKAKDADKVFYNFDYLVDVYNSGGNLIHNQGFDSFFVYTTHQLSGEEPLEYLMNIRRIGNEWKVNKFRDIAKLIDSTDAYYIGPHTGSNYGVPGANVAGAVTSSVVTTQEENMFTVDGMSEIINTNFINTSKSWHKKRKFIDKWIGIRLIYSNSTKNLIYLYATDVAVKQFFR